MSRKYLLSVVICSYNRALMVKKFLPNLISQIENSKHGDRVEVIIVDNNSTDTTSMLSQILSTDNLKIKTVFEERQGLAYARNKGIQSSQGDYIAFLDDDARVQPKWLETVISLISSDNYLLIGGPIYPEFERKKPWWVDKRDFMRFTNYENGPLPDNRAPYGFSGANMIYKKQALLAIDGFSECLNFKNNANDSLILGEEVDVSNRIYKIYGNKTYYHKDIAISHYEPSEKMTVQYYLKRYTAAGKSMFLIRKGRNYSKLYLLATGILLLNYGLYQISLSIVSLGYVRPSRGFLRVIQGVAFNKLAFSEIFT